VPRPGAIINFAQCGQHLGLGIGTHRQHGA
jgi:hypothetical protein